MLDPGDIVFVIKLFCHEQLIAYLSAAIGECSNIEIINIHMQNDLHKRREALLQNIPKLPRNITETGLKAGRLFQRHVPP